MAEISNKSSIRGRTTIGRSPVVIYLILLITTFSLASSADHVSFADDSKPALDRKSLRRETVMPQVDKINRAMTELWSENGMKPSPTEEESKWCRRVFLDVLGRIPTLEEYVEFSKEKGTDKHAALVRRLLYDLRYTEEYALHWSTVWTNILIGRNGGMENQSLTNRAGMQKYLRDCFASNRPYNTMVYELISAVGTTKPGTEGFNGATNFLAMKVNEEGATQATAAVSRIFLGLQVQCTQCHNHPFNQWKQQKFWELNAFFRQTRALRKYTGGRMVDHAELINEDFAGASGNAKQANIFYDLRNAKREVAYPVFIDGMEIERSGLVRDIVRRDELAKLTLQSSYLDKAIVNRTWAHFLGYGFTKPIDDLGPHNPTVLPGLLEELANDFRENSYDLKKLMTWITLSEPYRLSSRSIKENSADDPSQGESPKFSRFYTRQLSAEQLFQSLTVATQANRKVSLDEQQRRRDEWLKQFIVAFGTDEGDETTTFNGSIPQTLMLFNGELIKEAISLEPGSWLHSLANAKSSFNDKVQRLFLAGLGRRPRPDEIAIAQQILAARKNDLGAMLQDMWWAILNSNEFIFNH